jgi:hypothetical protein
LPREDRAGLWAGRTHHRPIIVGATDTSVGSRIGGRAPQIVADAPVRCPRCDGAMEYDATLVAADLDAALDVSLFHCRSFDCLLGGVALSRVRVPSPLQVAARLAGPRADRPTPNDSDLEGRALTIGAPQPDREDQGDPSQESKLGGEAGLLQSGEGLEQALAKDGLRFLFQISELDYPRGMAIGNYRYAGGNVYVFATFDANAVLVGDRCAAFWQRT